MPEKAQNGLQDQASPSNQHTTSDAVQSRPSNTISVGCFTENHIVFWLSAHTALLRQKASQAGAVLEDSITEKTSLVIAAKNTSATEAASYLSRMPASIPTRSKKFEGHKLKLPTNISFVVPQYISDCLAQNQVIPTAAYQITLQQVVTQDIRSYSAESYKGAVDESPQHSTATHGPSQEQHPSSSAQVTPADQAGQEAHNVDANVTPSIKRQKLDAADMSPPVQAAEDSSKDPVKKLGIYPDVDPAHQKFTGGSTGIVWGTGTHWFSRVPWGLT